MAVTLIGTGGLFTRLGKLVKWCRNLNGIRGISDADAPSTPITWGELGPTIVDVETAYEEIFDQFEATNESTALVASLPSQLTAFRSGMSDQLTTMQTLAAATLIYMVNEDSPLPSATLENSMLELIEQMTTAGTKVTGETITATVTAGSANVGTAVVIVSTLDHHGVQAQYAFAETIKIKCTTDENRGGTLGNETLTVYGEAANTDTLDYLWPEGSGASSTFSIADYDSDNTSGNLLTNSGFETFATTANLPDYWTRLVGVLGTTIGEGATAHNGSKSVKFTGDASTLTSISQVFDNSTTGTAGALEAPPLGPQSGIVSAGVYAVSLWVRVDAVPAAGVLKIDLIDGSAVTINDNNGTANSITRALTTLTLNTWTNVTGFFRLKTNLPSTMSIRLHLTTALSSGSILYMDDMALTAAKQLYAGGPYVAAFRGSTDATVLDSYEIAITNTMGATGGIFTEWFERFFGMRSTLGMQLPISGSGSTIADSLCE